MVNDYGKIFENYITGLVCTLNGKSLYASDEQGNLKQFSIDDGVLVADYGIAMDYGIFTMTLTMDGKYLF